MKGVLVLILFLFMLNSCNGVEPLPKPENLISRDKMEEIIYDMTIINSARGYNIQQFSRTGVKPESYVFEKHNIDSVQYAASTIYYSGDVEEYKKMIDNVKNKVEKEFKIKDSLAKIEKRFTDSIRASRAKKLKDKKDSTIQAQRLSGRVFPNTVNQ